MTRVVMTSTRIPLAEEAARAFAGLDVRFETVDVRTADELVTATRDADAVISLAEPFDADVIGRLGRCRSITRFGIGVDSVDVAAATERGIWVTNIPDANHREVAVHALALALSVTRRLPVLDRAMHADGAAPLALAAGTRRPDVQTFGIVGMGRIGRRVAELAAAVGYRVLATDPVVPAEAIAAAGAEPVGFDELVRRSDVLSLHVPLTDSTRHLVDAGVIDRMPRHAVLLNVSRGGLVDDTALAAAVRSGHLAGAGIDTHEGEPAPLAAGHPLLGLPNVVLTPHSAHYSVESFDEAKQKAVLDVARVLRGERPVYPVNEIGAVPSG
ncbi:C-terminal binding protein [Pseudonocardia kongjuensis]|uniref:C-terminal binding protein n=1 Tax=Pseudonocardia kongjuensis TaxID=102227 RepID=A0ABN1Y324_9PSEU